MKTFKTGNGLTIIPTDAFRYSSALTTVELGNKIHTINSGGFYSCRNLQNINFPEALKVIGTEAFYGCSSLKRVVLGKNVQTIGHYAFTSCNQLTYFAFKGEKQPSCGAKALPSSVEEVYVSYDYDAPMDKFCLKETTRKRNLDGSTNVMISLILLLLVLL